MRLGRLVLVNCSTDGGQTPRGLPASQPWHRHRSRDRSTSPHRQSAPASVRSAHPSCNGRIFAKGSHRCRSTQHMPWRCCRGTHRFRSKGQHSRFGSLPNRCRCCWSSGGGRSFGSSLSYRQPNPPKGVRWTVLELDRLLRGLGIRCDAFQDAQQFITIAGTIEQSRCNFKSHDKM